MSYEVKTHQTINGRNVRDMSDEELIMTIASYEAELKSLNSIDTESKGVKRAKDKIEDHIKQVVAVLDSRK